MKKIVGFMAASLLSMVVFTSTAQAGLGDLGIYSVVTITETGDQLNPFSGDSLTGGSVALGLDLPGMLAAEVELGVLGSIGGERLMRGSVSLVADPVLFTVGNLPVRGIARVGYSVLNMDSETDYGLLLGGGLGVDVTENVTLIVDYRRQFGAFGDDFNTAGFSVKYSY